ncbi:MAG TPA: hypothetical protein DCR20_00610 [Planctomycetaceae bacterium]|nr:hypothetical protein [Planctomycetaceae bacterium]
MQVSVVNCWYWSQSVIVGEVIDRSEVRVSRALVNFALDMLLLLLFVVLSLVSVIVQFVFPPGVSAKGWHLWGLNFGQWCGLQFGLLSVLGFGIVVHVMLHWTWICSVLARQILGQRDVPDNGLRTVYGVALLIGLLMTGAILIGLAMISIQMPPQG